MTADGLGIDIALTCRLLVGAVFSISGLLKLKAVRDFTGTLSEYPLLPSALVTPVAVFVISSELILGPSLIAGVLTKATASGSAVLLALFTLAVSTKLITRGSAGNCGCFGELTSGQPSWTILGRNVLLLGGSAYVAWVADWSLTGQMTRVDSLLVPNLFAVAGVALFLFLGPLAIESFVPSDERAVRTRQSDVTR